MAETSVKFIHLTDTHLIANAADDLYGSNPKERLKQAVQHILRRQANAQAVVITGDLTHFGHAQAYEHLLECLAPFPMPVYPVLGNHDDRETFKRHFSSVARDENGFVQYTADFAGYRAIFLDTNEPGVHWGVFCARRAAWLRTRLQETDKPVLLFMHHPFFPVGIPALDFISLRQPEIFLSAIAGHERRIQHVFFGHIHRPICGAYRGISYSTLRGTNHQTALELDGPADLIVGSHEQPQYGVVLLNEDQVLVHFEDFLDCGRRYPFHEANDGVKHVA
jgi:3',5'-cyclic AMP phosphodiesterase CpdA